MRRAMLKKLLIPIAGLTLAAFQASAAITSCFDIGGEGANAASLATVKSLTGAGGCEIGDFIFSNFDFSFSATGSEVQTPDASSNVMVSIFESNASDNCDVLGNCGAAANPMYQVTLDYSGDDAATASAIVSANQTQKLMIWYTLSLAPGAPGNKIISQIDGSGAAGVDEASDASASWSKQVCKGGTFNASGVCSNNNSVTVASTGFTPGPQDITQFFNMDLSALTSGSVAANFGNSIGVLDTIALNGGTTGSGPSAAAGEAGNFFFEGTASPTPEPGTMALFGAALVGLGSLRRRKA